ncbi:helix-turn-helix domain-containing protein [Clostridium sp. UBA871]|uniref:helix-turn-helix domain-containing protein n=1 Tax=Clostridium sp. UBA871 TaxID=1946380 RepID=UPI00321765F4
MAKPRELLKTDEVAAELGKPRTFITNQIRQGKLKAVKTGKEYLVSREDLNSYLGIETNEEGYKKDLYIKELEGKLKAYEVQFNTVKGLIGTLGNLINI